jgi:nitroreductase
MRRLKPDPVPDELLQKLVQAASWAPSAGNTQAMEFIIATDRALMKRLAGLWARSVDAYLGGIGEQTPAANQDRVMAAGLYQRDHFHETPALIIPCYKATSREPRAMLRMLSHFNAREKLLLLKRSRRLDLLAEASSV